MMDNLAKKLLILRNLPGVGAKTILKLATLPGIEKASLEACAQLDKRVAKALHDPSALERAEEAATADLDAAQGWGAHILAITDETYPDLLSDTPDPPPFLYVRGALAAVRNTQSIAIIGTRQPTRHGALIAERITEWFASNGWCIVSGLALGCDAVAHRTALKAGAPTVAAMPHGLHTVAPEHHGPLAEEIVEQGGALVSEYPFGTEPQPHAFVARDRIQAALSRGVVMVQSDEEGASLHAARAALRYGRVLAVPYPTAQDIDAKAREIGANLQLANGDGASAAELLKCGADDLERLVILRAKEEYPALAARLAE